MRNIAIQLVLRQCCKTRCMFLLLVLTYIYDQRTVRLRMCSGDEDDHGDDGDHNRMDRTEVYI